MLMHHIKFLITIIFIFQICFCQSEQKFGLTLYYSNKWDHALVQSHNSDIKNNGIYSLAELNFGAIKIVNSMFATLDSLESLKGGFRKVKGIYGYTNRAFITTDFELKNVKQKVLFGREYLFLGYGKFSSLIMSNISRPYDQFMWNISYRNIEGIMGMIQLDNIGNSKRYLNIHAVKYNNKKLSITFAEAILYVGDSRNFELQYFNPAQFWTAEIINNTTGDANALLYVGCKYNFHPSLYMWSELLIDDYQINSESKSDLEPNEIGLLVGIEKIGWPLLSSDLWLEYTLITNRTYQTPDVAETYTHRGFPMGHYLGNDFDMIQLNYSQKNLNGKLKPYISLAYLRDGINGLDTSFDTPWEDVTVTMETGYYESFPTPPITYIIEMEIGFGYNLFPKSFIDISYFYQYNNKLNIDTNISAINIRLLYYLGKTITY